MENISRVTPQNIEAEQSTIGACLMSREAIARASELLKPEHFYHRAHATIFESVLRIFQGDEGQPFFAVHEDLKRRGEIDNVRGGGYLTILMESCASAAAVEIYARAVLDKFMERELLKAADAVNFDVYFSDLTTEEKIDRAGSRFAGIGEKRAGSQVHRLSDLLKSEREAIAACCENRGGPVGLPTGFPDLDDMTTGLQPSDLIILAARPAIGKTSLSMQLAMNAAKHGERVLVFSLEMSKEQLTRRILSGEAQVNARDMRSGYLDETERQRIDTAAERIAALPVFIEDTPAQTTFQMHAHARATAAREGALGLIVIDYLQLAHDAGKHGNRVEEVTAIARSFKTLARQQGCPVIALSQLSRAVEQREDKRPVLSDLRESGEIEATADLVMMLYRADYYARKGERSLGAPIEQAELIIAKQRNGPTGTVALGWQPEFTRFVSMGNRWQ